MARSETVLAKDSANFAVNVDCIIIIGEVLFLISNNFEKIPKANLISLVSSFCTVEELVNPKGAIFSLTGAAHLSDM